MVFLLVQTLLTKVVSKNKDPKISNLHNCCLDLELFLSFFIAFHFLLQLEHQQDCLRLYHRAQPSPPLLLRRWWFGRWSSQSHPPSTSQSARCPHRPHTSQQSVPNVTPPVCQTPGECKGNLYRVHLTSYYKILLMTKS